MKVLFIAHSSGFEGSSYALINIIKGILPLGHHPIGLPFKTVQELVEQMNKAYTMSSSEYVAITNNALQSLHKYTIEENAQQIISFYKKLLKK